MNAKNAALTGLIAFTIVYGGYRLARSLVSPMQGFDFSQYYVTGRLLLQGEPERIYEQNETYQATARQVGVRGEFWGGGNAYPPFMAVFSIPFAYLSYSGARLLFFFLSLAAMAGAIPLLFANRPPRRRRELIGLGWCGLFVFWPTFFTLNHGQINGFLFLFCSLGLYFIRKQCPLRAGFFIAAAAVIKIFPLVLLPLFLLKRQYRLIGATLICMALLTALTLPLCGLEAYQAFFQEVLPRNFSAGSELRNQGFVGFLEKLLTDNGHVASLGDFPNEAKWIARACSVLVLAATVFITRRRKEVESYRYELEYGLYFVVALLVLAKSYEHYGLFLLFAYFTVADVLTVRRSGGVVPLGVAAVSFCLWSFVMTWHYEYATLPAGNAAMNLLASAKFFGTLMLFSVTIWLLRNKKDPALLAPLA